MSQQADDRLTATGYVQESTNGTTHVASPTDPAAFQSQATVGSIYAEFNVSQDSVKPTQQGWAKILGPNTLEGHLAEAKRQPIPQMPPATDTKHLITK